ncbi:hypothetical protein FSB80_23165, partial [Pseudomonas aeruginosa]
LALAIALAVPAPFLHAAPAEQASVRAYRIAAGPLAGPLNRIAAPARRGHPHGPPPHLGGGPGALGPRRNTLVGRATRSVIRRRPAAAVERSRCP